MILSDALHAAPAISQFDDRSRIRELGQLRSLTCPICRAGAHFTDRDFQLPQGLAHGDRAGTARLVQLTLTIYIVWVSILLAGRFARRARMSHHDYITAVL